MDMCGYHLRCLNYGNNCSECSYQHDDKNRHYLNDVLRFQPGSEEIDYLSMSLVKKYQKRGG
jgi:hypothetical protein